MIESVPTMPRRRVRGVRRGTRTRAEGAARLEAVELALTTRGNYLPAAAARELAIAHKVGERQIWYDVRRVRARWIESLPKSRPEAQGGIVAQLALGKQRALEAGRLDTHVRQLRLEAEVTGALEPVAVEVRGRVDVAALDAEAQARAILDAVPEARRLLGLPAAPEERDVIDIPPEGDDG